MQSYSSRKTFRPRPFGRLALDATLPFDGESPGTLRRVLCASPLRRQCWFHTLAVLNWNHSDDYQGRLSLIADPNAWATDRYAEIARLLTTRRVRDIVNALHGPV